MEPVYIDKLLFQKMFGHCVREARENLALSLSQLRDLTGIPVARLEKIEAGQAVIRENTRTKVALALNLSEGQLEQLEKVARFSFIDDLTEISWSGCEEDASIEEVTVGTP